MSPIYENNNSNNNNAWPHHLIQAFFFSKAFSPKTNDPPRHVHNHTSSTCQNSTFSSLLVLLIPNPMSTQTAYLLIFPSYPLKSPRDMSYIVHNIRNRVYAVPSKSSSVSVITATCQFDYLLNTPTPHILFWPFFFKIFFSSFFFFLF